MRGQGGFFDVDDRLKELSAKGDDLERLNAIVDFEVFRPGLARAVPRSDGSKGGRPAFDHVFMFKVLILQAAHGLSDERAEYLIKDRLSFMRFLGVGLADAVPDANTIWTFREALTRARIDGQPAIEVLFKAYEAALTKAGYLAMGGQIIDASIVAAPKQRNTDGEKREIKAGRIPEAWQDKPAKLAQKDRDARWTVKWSKAKPADDGSPRRSGDPGLRLQEPHQHRPAAWADPDLGHDRRCAPRRGATAEPDLKDEHRQRGLRRYRLPLEGQREAPRRQQARLAHPPQEAEGQADAGKRRSREQRQVQGPRRGRACLRPPEGTDGPLRPNHRHGSGHGEDRPRQHRLQHEARRLAERAGDLRLTPGRRPRKSRRVPTAPAAPANTPPPNMPSRRPAPTGPH